MGKLIPKLRKAIRAGAGRSQRLYLDDHYFEYFPIGYAFKQHYYPLWLAQQSENRNRICQQPNHCKYQEIQYFLTHHPGFCLLQAFAAAI